MEDIPANNLTNQECVALLAARGHKVTHLAWRYVDDRDMFGRKIQKIFAVYFMVGTADIAYRLPIMGEWDALHVHETPRQWDADILSKYTVLAV